MSVSPGFTAFQAKYFAYFLTREGIEDADGLTQSLSSARVDLNPHQVEAAMFALRSPISKGVLLADEVGLGKTIEAALVMTQRWWERRRRLLLITPASLRKQWAQELAEKFSLPSTILDAKRVKEMAKAGNDDPLAASGGVIILSYEYAARIADRVRAIPWDLVVFDEAHKLRNVYRALETSRSAVLRDALADRQKLLLTATPLQNNLMELYGLVTIIDDQFFGSPEAFRAEFGGREDGNALSILGRRLEPICKRTLRRQVQKAGLINYTNRMPRTFDFTPDRLEADLYDHMSDYLQRDGTLAVGKNGRHLVTLVLRKTLGSSSFAIAATLGKMVNRLEAKLPISEETLDDIDSVAETAEEWREGDQAAEADALDDETAAAVDQIDSEFLKTEIAELARYRDLAAGISTNAKGRALLESLPLVLDEIAGKGGERKAVIFTESVRTQAYLRDLLEAHGFAGQTVILNGSNSDKDSQAIYRAWMEIHRGTEAVSGSKTADMKAALVDSYLFMTGKSRNFFVLAPNLTIYEKLLADFQPSSPKYVFKGVEAFAHQPPLIVNAENYEEGRGVRGMDLLGREAAIINIFNISKINSEVRGGRSPRIKRLQEYIGESYFAYLAALPDLVLLMDEAHRYRASAGARAISELKPILGIEVTATPKSVGANSANFRNVIYRYDLPEAMADGYVKEPAVGTRANFDPKSVSGEMLETIKLEDGVHYHEYVKVQLQTYAKQNDTKLVTPFMLIVAQDTHHARNIREFIESEAFFGGAYAGKVAEIHSKLTGDESDENAQRLLNIESDGQTEIVIHVNKLKEGWDVSNLYTIVPLRASASEILTEQTLGRGLRLPYGKRTGVEAVDTLTVIAHDRFNEIIERAKTADGLVHAIKQVLIGDGGDVPVSKPVMIEAPSIIQTMIQQAGLPAPIREPGVAEPDPPRFSFNKPEEIALAETAFNVVLPSFQTKLSSVGQLRTPKVIREIAADALAVQRASEGLFKSEITTERAEAVVAELCAAFAERTIAIPQMIISPVDQVSFGFKGFQLEGLSSWNYQPVSRELLVQILRTEKRSFISGADGGERASRIEDYVILRLIDFPEIDYAAHSELLYDLVGQVVARLRSYLFDDEDVRNVLINRGNEIANAIFTQMKQHMWRTQTAYKVTLHAPFTMLKPQAFDGAGADVMRDFRQAPQRLSEIKRFVFTGFTRSCYWQAKFDSDTERQMAVLLDKDGSVELWMKPGPGQFRITDADGNPYQPDFVVETKTEKLIIETKRRSDLNDADVQRKADAAKLWCHIATEHHAKAHGEKPWRYVLIPDDAVQPNATLAGLVSAHTLEVDMALLGQYELALA